MKITITTLCGRALGIAAGAFILLTCGLSAATANFDTDTYPSAAGNGWAGAWTLTSNAGIGRSAAVASTTPLSTGYANYLHTTITNNGTNTGVRAGTLYRQIDSGSVNLTSAFTVSFDFRGNDAANADGPYKIIQTTASSLGAGTADTWSVYIKSDGNWYALNGNKAGGGTESLLLAYSANTTYHFSISVDSSSRSYGIVATAIGGSAATLNNLGFRTSATSAGSFINLLSTSSYTGSAFSNTFDIDNVIVTTAIPEPASFTLLAGLGGLALMMTRRRRTTTPQINAD